MGGPSRYPCDIPNTIVDTWGNGTARVRYGKGAWPSHCCLIIFAEQDP